MFKNKKRVFVVEDNLLIRTAVKRSLESTEDFELVGEWDDALGLGKQISLNRPDILLLDLRLRDSNGLDLLPELKKNYPSMKVVVYTMKEDMPTFLAAVKAGADGYILKSDNPLSLGSSLNLALDGKFVTSRQFSQIQKRASGDDKFNPLEKAVLQQLKSGTALSKVLEEASVSKEQLEEVLMSLKVKLEAKSYPDLVRIIKEKTFA
ncbi:DNA-binding response regulator [Leptospira idonii]|uniref:DNA-binding response regulator n=1 Tax=Leptospira idonii TaxID=1193500 RepID=A0A4R9M3S5_9LEPT|nr:DNA-binding response regulator [Leptospira idonii]